MYITPNTPKSTAIALKVSEPLLGKVYTVWMGSYYNSPALAHFMKRHNADCVGIFRVNRKNVLPRN
jgi:hypothetical protein